MKEQNEAELNEYVSMIERILGNPQSRQSSTVDEESKELQEMILPGSTDVSKNTETERELEEML
jgi:hypothetical protein